jgi:acyl-CoA reductase-like NAD-dependent aldehyde dehydrogenase
MPTTEVRSNRGAQNIPLLIGGQTIDTEHWSEVTDPGRPSDVVGRAASATAEQSRRAVDAAHSAWKGWSALEPERRAELLIGALDRLDTDHQQRLELLVRENGKIRAEAQVELGVFRWRCQLAAKLAGELRQIRRLEPLHARPAPELREESDHAAIQRYVAPPFRSEVSLMPLGVVTIIVPYNWPIAILAASLPYALIAGNTVIVKPPPTTPLCIGWTLRLLASALPPGVINVVSGTNEAVAPVISDPRVRRIVFTGSTGGGKAIMKMAAENVTRVTLELGGNDPALVLADAQLDRAGLQRLVVASFTTAGQVCMGIKRIYVHRSRYDELVQGMSEILSHFSVGHGLKAESTMGPLNSAKQRDFVRSLSDEARAAGHEVRALGRVDEEDSRAGGYFLPPTLVLDPAPALGIVQQEQFGPALPILRFDDVDPIIEQVNADWSGLCSSVWTGNPERAAAIAARLRTGTTWVNNANAVAQDDRAPFGGFRQSGLGRELGTEGLLEFTEPHTVTYPG